MIPVRYFLIALLAAGLGGGGAMLMNRSAAVETVDGARAFPMEVIELPDIAVLDGEGRALSLRKEAVGDALLVVNFNFTTCETICPVGNVVMKAIDDRARTEVPMPVRLLSITIDPARDTPRKMREAAREAGASAQWLWLTGAPADIDLLLGRFDARAADIQFHDPMFLIGDARSGRFRRIVGLPKPERVLEELRGFAS
ncbi:SCO family protein [Aquamicrobium terrae]|uniref:Protein SCO1/2 n=1 Tax=Aquamicrobium terrae TaxID=1324945 RepID=A0ABV2N6S2_9HYPH